jgi:hypothetical protein
LSFGSYDGAMMMYNALPRLMSEIAICIPSLVSAFLWSRLSLASAAFRLAHFSFINCSFGGGRFRKW